MSSSETERALATLLEWNRLPKPEVEYRFHSSRRWRFDFAYPDLMIGIEVEGGTWTGGRHAGGSGFTEDCVKYNEAAILGWRVLRFTTNMIRDGRALDQIERALK